MTAAEQEIHPACLSISHPARWLQHVDVLLLDSFRHGRIGMVGFNKPVAVSIVVGATNFLFGFVNFAFIDNKYGRRVVLLITVIGMESPCAAPIFHN
jgi:hypothetical protein